MGRGGGGKDTDSAVEIKEGFQEEVAVAVSWSQARAGEVLERPEQERCDRGVPVSACV